MMCPTGWSNSTSYTGYFIKFMLWTGKEQDRFGKSWSNRACNLFSKGINAVTKEIHSVTTTAVLCECKVSPFSCFVVSCLLLAASLLLDHSLLLPLLGFGCELPCTVQSGFKLSKNRHGRRGWRAGRFSLSFQLLQTSLQRSRILSGKRFLEDVRDTAAD